MIHELVSGVTSRHMLPDSAVTAYTRTPRSEAVPKVILREDVFQSTEESDQKKLILCFAQNDASSFWTASPGPEFWLG